MLIQLVVCVMWLAWLLTLQVVLSNLRAHGYTDKLTLISDEGQLPSLEGTCLLIINRQALLVH
jgi:hypothetical protein